MYKHESKMDKNDKSHVLLNAVKTGKYTEVEKLLNDRLSVSTSDKLGLSLLHYAAKYNRSEIMELLLNKGANINKRTMLLRTPLHLASYYGYDRCVKILISRKASINLLDVQHMTALHWAAQNGFLNVVKLLINADANPLTRNKDGKLPYELATEAEHTTICDVLQKYIAIGASNRNCFYNGHPSNRLYFRSELDDFSRMNHNDENILMKPNLKRSAGDMQDKISKKLKQRDMAKLFENHGIKVLPVDESPIITSAVQNGQTIVLTEAGKLALKSTEKYMLRKLASMTNVKQYNDGSEISSENCANEKSKKDAKAEKMEENVVRKEDPSECFNMQNNLNEVCFKDRVNRSQMEIKLPFGNVTSLTSAVSDANLSRSKARTPVSSITTDKTEQSLSNPSVLAAETNSKYSIDSYESLQSYTQTMTELHQKTVPSLGKLMPEMIMNTAPFRELSESPLELSSTQPSLSSSVSMSPSSRKSLPSDPVPLFAQLPPVLQQKSSFSSSLPVTSDSLFPCASYPPSSTVLSTYSSVQPSKHISLSQQPTKSPLSSNLPQPSSSERRSTYSKVNVLSPSVSIQRITAGDNGMIIKIKRKDLLSLTANGNLIIEKSQKSREKSNLIIEKSQKSREKSIIFGTNSESHKNINGEGYRIIDLFDLRDKNRELIENKIPKRPSSRNRDFNQVEEADLKSLENATNTNQVLSNFKKYLEERNDNDIIFRKIINNSSPVSVTIDKTKRNNVDVTEISSPDDLKNLYQKSNALNSNNTNFEKGFNFKRLNVKDVENNKVKYSYNLHCTSVKDIDKHVSSDYPLPENKSRKKEAISKSNNKLFPIRVSSGQCGKTLYMNSKSDAYDTVRESFQFNNNFWNSPNAIKARIDHPYTILSSNDNELMTSMQRSLSVTQTPTDGISSRLNLFNNYKNDKLLNVDSNIIDSGRRNDGFCGTSSFGHASNKDAESSIGQYNFPHFDTDIIPVDQDRINGKYHSGYVDTDCSKTKTSNFAICNTHYLQESMRSGNNSLLSCNQLRDEQYSNVNIYGINNSDMVKSGSEIGNNVNISSSNDSDSVDSINDNNCANENVNNENDNDEKVNNDDGGDSNNNETIDDAYVTRRFAEASQILTEIQNSLKETYLALLAMSHLIQYNVPSRQMRGSGVYGLLKTILTEEKQT